MSALIISFNSFREFLRNKLVYVCLVLAIFLLAISLFLGVLSFTEHQRILIHFGMSAVHLSALTIVCFLGTSVLAKEIERQTCLLVLARPVTRGHFLVGKWLGVHWLVMLLILTLLAMMVFLLEFRVSTLTILQMGLGIYLEMMILLSLAIFLSTFMGSAFALFSVIGLFLTGNWLEEMDFFAQKMGGELLLKIADYIDYVIPNLYKLNWRSVDYTQNGVPAELMTWGFVHAIGWSGLFLVAAVFIFRRKDLV